MRLPPLIARAVGAIRGRGQERDAWAAPGDGVLIRHAAMDKYFQERCAIFSDGACLMAEDYQRDNRLIELQLSLITAGQIPRNLDRRVVGIGEIRQAWGVAAEDQVQAEGSSATENRARNLFAAAARARASDLCLWLSGEKAQAYAIVNDRRIPIGAPMPRQEGLDLAMLIFARREAGSGQSSYQASEFQGFAIRAGEAPWIPETVAAMRGERGRDEPAGDHLMVRLYYHGQIDGGMTLESLGYTPEEAGIFKEIRLSLHGAVIIGGTTGDGKSTTLAVNLMQQNEEFDSELHVVTIEDPVEYEIPHAVQCPVSTAGTGEDREEEYRKTLNHFVRMHPGSGMVSEIRDREAAKEVFQFVDTGHQVWTTLHVYSANGILFRLLDMGVTAAEICKPGNVRLLVKQTLVARLCQNCATEEPPEGKELPPVVAARFASWPGVRYRNRAGCQMCRRTGDGDLAQQGWNGFTTPALVAEIIRPDAAYMEFVRQADAHGAMEYWKEHLGGEDINDKMWKKVAVGAVDPFDALRKGADAATVPVRPPTSALALAASQ